MKIRLSVWVGTTSTQPRRVTVTAPAGCAVEDLAADRIAGLLATTLGVTGDRLVVGGHLLPADAVLGRPPLLDGASVRLVDAAGWRPPTRSAPTSATELAVIGGPDAGRFRPLTAGRHTIGRSGADLTVADPSVSRLHAALMVTPAGISITDLGSENGTSIGDSPVSSGGSGVEVAVGSVLRLGHTTLAIRPSRTVPLATVARGDGTVSVSRSAALPPVPPTTTIAVPSMPEAPAPRRIPWIAAAAPVPIALLLAYFLGPHLLLLAAMSPVLMLAGVASERFGSKRTYARQRLEHDLALANCVRARDHALAAERLWRETNFPDPAAIARIAATPGSALWSRSAGPAAPLPVRIGRGESTSAVSETEGSDSRRLSLTDAPVVLDLVGVGSLSIVGDRCAAVADGIVGQLVTLCSPADLRVLTDRTAWVDTPHATVADPAALLRDALALTHGDETTPADAAQTPVTVLVLSARNLDSTDLTTLSALCREGPGAGVLVIVTDAHLTAARALLDIGATGAAALRVGDEESALVIDGVGAGWVEKVARSVTPLRDVLDVGGLPESIGLVDTLHPESSARTSTSLTGTDIEQRWATCDDGAWVTLGAGAGGPFRIDLATAGPHTLIGGTTGSGKSELLRTLVASLASEHPPEDVAVVLIDYKGGSAFTGLEALPHIVGMVTDLDSGLTRRALRSLRAEIHRREELIARAGVADILGYRRRSRTTSAALPHLSRLVIVVDEFRALSDELPDFVSGLVHLAAVGRSLGLHLVLATQRPAGVVTADMRANLNLRIALRVRDRTDSQDVIDSDAAALIPRQVPGRALLRCGSDDLVPVQVASLTGASRRTSITAEVAWSDGTSTIRDLAVNTGPDADLVAVVAAAGGTSAGHRAPPPPWLPPLPQTLHHAPGDPAAGWALVDEPGAQRQWPAEVELATWPLTAIAGSVGSGRTTAARSLALAAAAADPNAHLYVIADSTGALATLGQLPHTGAVIDRTDPATLAWFTERLAGEVRRRQSRAADAHLLVVIDGWDVLADTCDELDHGQLTDRLLAVLREGYAVGLRAVVTGDRSVLSGRVSRTFPERYLLRPSDDTDIALAGLRPSDLPSQWPAGRLVRTGDGREQQVLLRTLGDQDPPPPSARPWRVVPLPENLPLSHSSVESDVMATDLVTVGLGGDGDPVTLGQSGRRRVLVLGSPGAGRTTTLATIALSAQARGRAVCVITETGADLDRLTDAVAQRLSWSDRETLIDLRRAHPDLVVVADDVGRHLDAPVVPVLEQIADLAESDGGLIAVAGDSAAISLRSRGLGAAVARGRTSIVVGVPAPVDAEVVGLRLPRVGQVVPGRGWLVAERRSVPIQVALPRLPRRSAMTGVIPRS